MNWYDLTVIKKLKKCYELILPTIYNESLSFEQKLNKITDIIMSLVKNGIELTEELIQLQEYIQQNIENITIEQLNKWLQDGTLSNIINNELFGELNKKIEYIERYKVYYTSDYVIPNGNSDNTEKLQQAINEAEGNILIFSGNPFPYRTNQLTLKSNSIYIFMKNTTLKANDTWVNPERWQDPLIDIRQVENVKIYGNSGIITMNKPTQLVTEHAHCMGTRGAKNVYIENLNLTNASGDGFYIDQYDGDENNTPSEAIKLYNIKCDNNGRNGLSIVSGFNIIIENSYFTNTNGTSPQTGLDIEAEARTRDMTNIIIKNCKFKNNRFCGFSVVGGSSSITTEHNITVINCEFNEEATGVYINNIKDNSIGIINITDCYFKNTSRNAILDGNNSNKGIRRIYKNCYSLNANTSNGDQNDQTVGERGWASAFQIYAKDRNCGNCCFINCRAEDNRNTKLVKTGYAITREQSSQNVINLVEIIGSTSYQCETSYLANFSDIYNLTIDEVLERNKITPNADGSDYVNAKNYYCLILSGTIYINQNNNIKAKIKALNDKGTTTILKAGSGAIFCNDKTKITLNNKGAYVELETLDGKNFYISSGNDYTLN